MQSIVLGGGCFWCTEAVFQSVKGVQSVISGYAGGQAHTANYEMVCDGDTGHIEVVQVDFDEGIIDLATLLDVFFVIHDPTTQDRQGNDVGRQYASVIFYTDDKQLPIIKQKIANLQKGGINVVTEVYPASIFYPAEDYHQNFYANNPTQAYCNFVILPKLAKLKENFVNYLK